MQFSDLGPLGVTVDGSWTPVKGRLAPVLGTLLMHLDRRVSVDLLVDAVWGDEATTRAVGTLETHVWRLRRLLEPDRRRDSGAGLLINDTGGYRLVAHAAEVDSALFAQQNLHVLDLLTSNQPERALRTADQALALWRGEPYDYLADRAWAAGPVGRLVETWTQLQERRIDALLGTGRAAQALVDLEPLLSAYPLRERLWWQRMLALHHAGRTDDALRAYRLARTTLMNEIGLDPGRELEELHGRILNRDESLTPPSQLRSTGGVARGREVRLPRERPVLGRDDERVALQRMLHASRLVTLGGPAGCGKTLLAVETARVEVESFPDGAVFIDLSAASPHSDVAAVIATGLGLAIGDAHPALSALATFAAENQTLLILDNCEQILDEVAAVLEVLTESTRQTSVLATSREPFNVTGEAVLQLAPLALSTEVSEDAPLSEQETAAALFLTRAQLPDDLSTVDRYQVRRICRAVDGLPLAIELAAALAQTFTLVEVAEQVEHDPGRLAAIGRGQATHHQSLSAAIDSSYALLSEQEQALHRRLAVLPGTFGRDLAEAVAGPGLAPEVPALLARLAHRSLLVATPGPSGTRLSQLAPIRSHASRVLARVDERQLAERSRDGWVAELVDRKPRVGRLEEGRWHGEVRQELAVVRRTLYRSLVLEPDPLGASIALGLTGFWFYADLSEEGVSWAQRGVTQTPAHELDGVSARLSLAVLLAASGRADQSRESLHDALELLSSNSHGLGVVGRPSLDGAQQLRLGELLVGVSNASSITRDAESMHECLDAVSSSGLLDVDRDLAVTHAASACLVEAVEGPTGATLVRAEAAFEQAESAGNLSAAWIAASTVAALALGQRNAGLGELWSRRVLDNQSRLGATTVTMQVETLGDFLAMAGRLTEAVHLFSAGHHQSRRAARSWPRNPVTSELLESCREQLGPAEFNRSWAEGRGRTRAELLS